MTGVGCFGSTIGKRGPAAIEKWPVEVQDFRKFTDKFREFCRLHPNLIKKNRKLSTWNWFDLETLGSQPIMPKNLPKQCFWIQIFHTFSKFLVWKRVQPKWTNTATSFIWTSTTATSKDAPKAYRTWNYAKQPPTPNQNSGWVERITLIHSGCFWALTRSDFKSDVIGIDKIRILRHPKAPVRSV